MGFETSEYRRVSAVQKQEWHRCLRWWGGVRGAVVAVAVALTAPRIWTSDYPLSYQDTIAPIGEHNGLNDRAGELARITARSLKRNTSIGR